ncbi:MAG: valine--tRNA ligase [Flavobacteriales bacterium]|nr:valine--tRNA ligase [Flavobacteriales bacterium]
MEQQLEKTYNPSLVEPKWYSYWMHHQLFRSVPDNREPYTILIPPPNVTGVLHMGHMLNNTIQDVLIRKARMEGKNACWVPGTDHASIATEAKVVAMLREKGIKKSDLTRDEFLKYAWEWKEKYGGIILEQLKKLGASCDWERTRFTMDEKYYRAVIRVFVDYYNKGYIYRGLRMINWDCEAKTALSNEEVIYKEEGEVSILYSIRYALKGSSDSVVIATQRPETIMGDVAIAVNPTDERYTHLIGKKALVPFINREIPIIADNYVEKDFGTGCLKVTPAHDANDYEIGLRHKLPIIDTINLDGTLNEACEIPEFVGLDRFEVRKRIVKKLREAGLIVEEKEFITKIGRSERTNTVVEPKLSEQWFIRMKEVSRRAMEAVENDEIRLHPAKFKNTYRHWMENVRDWCISRQLWWGHRIPAWYLPNGEFVVAENEEQALQLAQQKNPSITLADLKQDEDVLDTWASSWLWPIAVFDGFEDLDLKTGKLSCINPELAYYYPTDVLVTAPEILFFWVARMIMAGYEYMNDKPFKDVYLTGIVRDKLGRKMSKSLGNSPDPLELIEKYSADGVRVGMLFSSPAGNDLLFDESLCEQGRNFTNKIWNALRLVKGWDVDSSLPASSGNSIAIQWFESRFNQVLEEVNDLYAKFRMSEALMATYKLIWDDFCSWYLEIIKPAFGHPIDEQTYQITIKYFEDLMKLLHPLMPFITEEIWHQLKARGDKESIMLATWPKAASINSELLRQFEIASQVISQIRNFRKSKNIHPKETLQLFISGKNESIYNFQPIIIKLGNLHGIQWVNGKVEQAFAFVADNTECFIPFTDTLDLQAEKDRILKEIDYLQGFLKSVSAKLNNPGFIAKAKPEVVAMEQKKKTDAENKISMLQAQLESLQLMNK